VRKLAAGNPGGRDPAVPVRSTETPGHMGLVIFPGQMRLATVPSTRKGADAAQVRSAATAATESLPGRTRLRVRRDPGRPAEGSRTGPEPGGGRPWTSPSDPPVVRGHLDQRGLHGRPLQPGVSGRELNSSSLYFRNVLGKLISALCASLLMEDLFGNAGRHSRAELGVAELPAGAPVETELIVEVKSHGT
jgi:hypothetical protein